MRVKAYLPYIGRLRRPTNTNRPRRGRFSEIRVERELIVLPPALEPWAGGPLEHVPSPSGLGGARRALCRRGGLPWHAGEALLELDAAHLREERGLEGGEPVEAGLLEKRGEGRGAAAGAGDAAVDRVHRAAPHKVEHGAEALAVAVDEDAARCVAAARQRVRGRQRRQERPPRPRRPQCVRRGAERHPAHVEVYQRFACGLRLHAGLLGGDGAWGRCVIAAVWQRGGLWASCRGSQGSARTAPVPAPVLKVLPATAQITFEFQLRD